MFKGKVALIIDDSETERYMLKKVLMGLECEVLEAKDGFMALELLDQKNIQPHVVFVDANMPGMTGYQVIRQIKLRERLQEVPIVMCTADDVEDNERWAKYNGASELFGKPVSREKLVYTLNNLFKQK